TALLAGILLAGASLLPVAASANPYPNQPVKIIVGYPPGGSADITGRIMADAMSERLGTTVIVENIGGAGGSIGANRVVTSKPDGYTILIGANNEIALNNLTNPNIQYDGIKDLAHIGLVVSQPLVVLANPGTGIKSPEEL